MLKKQKITLFAIVLFASAAVISGVSIALVLSSDKMKTTADALTRLRTLMKGTSSVKMEPLTAYIVPSDDAHQVSVVRL